MEKLKALTNKIFLAVSSIGVLFVLTEIIMQSLGKSICFTEGCKIAAQAVRFGEISILLLGLLMFLSLAVLAAINLRHKSDVIERLINFILVVALACEGFFMGYLAFRLYTVCIFCVIVFGFLVTLGVLRLLAKQHEVLAGFAALAAIFTLLYLVLPAGGMMKALPENERLILFYSKDCKYCAAVIAELDAKKITAKHLDIAEYGALLKSMGIEYVPTLFVNEPNQKVFFTGQDAITRYLQACSSQKKAVKKNGSSKKDDLKLELYNQQGLLPIPGSSPTGTGMCKEEEICK